MKILNETYKINDFKQCRRYILSLIGGFLHQANTRGNGIAVTILCEILNKLYGSSLNPNDYILHHRNGNHDDNSLKNLVLFNKRASHSKTHIEIWESAMQEYVYQVYKLPNNSVINLNSFANLNVQLFLNIYLRVAEKRTDRKSLKDSNDDIIIISEFIF